MLVRLRPNGPYLLVMLVCALLIVLGLVRAGLLGALVATGGGVMLVVFGHPVLASTIGRVPVLAVGDDGIRLPLMGVRLGWAEISTVRRGAAPGGSAPVLLIFPADPAAVIARMRPWLRRTARDDLVRYGTPIVVRDASLDHSIDAIAAAVRRHHPGPPDTGPGPATA